MRLTHATVAVAMELMAKPQSEHWGYEILKASGLGTGSAYTILQRFVDEGILEDTWEDPAIAESEKRPPRRLYRLTPTGAVQLGALLRRAQSEQRFTLGATKWALGT